MLKLKKNFTVAFRDNPHYPFWDAHGQWDKSENINYLSKMDNVDYLEKPQWFFFDIFALHSSSRHKKCCQMSVRLFPYFKALVSSSVLQMDKHMKLIKFLLLHFFVMSMKIGSYHCTFFSSLYTAKTYLLNEID